MVGVMRVYSALVQIPGLETPDLTMQERLIALWEDMAIMAVALSACVVIGIVVIVYKFFDLVAKSSKTKSRREARNDSTVRMTRSVKF